MRDIVSPFSTISGKSPKGKYIIFVRGGSMQHLKISCQDVPLPKGYYMRNKLKPRIPSVCYCLKCCMESRFSKMRKKL
jgi:hypothetical protein